MQFVSGSDSGMKGTVACKTPLGWPCWDSSQVWGGSVDWSPRRVAQKHDETWCMSERSTWYILHNYTQQLKLCKHLSHCDRGALQFYHQFLELMAGNPCNILMSKEIHFNLLDTVNKQNCQYWATGSLHELYEYPLYFWRIWKWLLFASFIKWILPIIGEFLYYQF
jgi:hypothetical protein